ncbi:MAG: hypothetical protein FJ253_11725 [Phycisphaerae bacterium]|nr:hypothetical protein [Phycisphaerae bacterium]
MLTPLDPAVAMLLQSLAFAGMLLLAVLGGALVAKSWRGRLLSWAPTCARCGFDLRARSADLPRECPECGRSLAGAVTAGPRRTAFGRLALGSLLILLSFASGAAVLFRVPASVNAWMLEQRSIASFDAALDANDVRAWRHLGERMRLGRMDPTEATRLLDRIIDRATKVGQWSPADENLIGSMAQAASPPPDLERRVLDATLALPNPVRVRVFGEAPEAGRPFAISVELGRVPLLVKLPLEARIESVTLASGSALPEFPPASIAGPKRRDTRAPIGVSLYTAPALPGLYDATVTVGVRLGAAESSEHSSGGSGAAPASHESQEDDEQSPPLLRLRLPLNITVKPGTPLQ